MAEAVSTNGKIGPGGMLDFDALRAAVVKHEPYDYMLATDVLTSEESADVRRDYPDITKHGYLPLSKMAGAGEAFDRLIADVESPELAKALSDLMGVDLTDKPRMTTIRKLSAKSDGTIHVDSKSKILTMLIYLNAEWDGTGAGVLRVLNGPKDFEDYTEQVPPLEGTLFAFLRSDTSWHGHLPFEGERYVIQTAFLTSQEELDRKEKPRRSSAFPEKAQPVSVVRQAPGPVRRKHQAAIVQAFPDQETGHDDSQFCQFLEDVVAHQHAGKGQ